MPHPEALFSLVPKNSPAQEALKANPGLVSILSDGREALDVGHRRSTTGDSVVLATLGRTGDIYVPHPQIARLQGSFEIDAHTNVVMFYDRSFQQSSRVFGDNSFPFERGRPRKIVVQDRINRCIGMGGAGGNIVEFELVWHVSSSETVAKVKALQRIPLHENPILARTIDEGATVAPSRGETRPHTAGSQQKIRSVMMGKLGSGMFGEVFDEIDVDAGRYIAVKVYTRDARQAVDDLLRMLKREVDSLSSVSHPHVVEYISSEGWSGTEDIRIFMGKEEGTLYNLFQSATCPIDILGQTVLHHMLQALDCLVKEGIIHRDLKPENIFYTSTTAPDHYHFRLGDFGLSNRRVDARTYAGSQLYMAPEVRHGGEQTHKVDIWGLYVTILEIFDVDRAFRKPNFRTSDDVYDTIRSISEGRTGKVSGIREMGRENPQQRASAAQMLVKWFGGKGLISTTVDLVPAIVEIATVAPTRMRAMQGRQKVQQARQPPRRGCLSTLQSLRPRPAGGITKRARPGNLPTRDMWRALPVRR